MSISRWDPTRELLSVHDVMNRLFDRSVWLPSAPASANLQPAVDLYAEGEGYVVEVALPGLKPEEIDVEVVGSTLTISGEVKAAAPEGRQYLVRQRPWGRYQATLTLPEAVEAGACAASYDAGVLKLEIPKSEAAKPKRITLKSDN